MNQIKTIYNDILRAADAHPEKNAIISDQLSLSYSELLRQIGHLSHALARAGIQRGDRVAIGTVHKANTLMSIIAAMAVESIPVPLAESSMEDISKVLKDARPGILIVDEAARHGIVTHQQEASLLCIEEVQKDKGSFCLEPERDISDVAIIFYTSGTTSGEKKGVLVTYGNLAATVNYMNDFMGLQSDIVEYVVPPINHAFGFGRCRAVFRAGGTLVFDDGVFSPAKALVALEKHRCNAVSSVSTGFAILLEHYEKYFISATKNIKWVEIGSLYLEASLKKKLAGILVGAKVVMNYGLTEAMRTTLVDYKSELSKVETVGRPAPGVEVRIVNDAGQELPPAMTGEIVIKGPNVAKGYWQKEAQWQERYSRGWLKTGDVGYLDRDGYVVFVGRKDDIINVGGKKFSPLDIEASLKGILKNVPYCVCGVADPDGLLGEIPVLCVEGNENVSIMDVQRSLREYVEEYQIPKRMCRFPTLPRTHNGKIKRNEIKEQILRMGLL